MENLEKQETEERPKASPRENAGEKRKKKKLAVRKTLILTAAAAAAVSGILFFVIGSATAKRHMRKPVVIEENEAMKTLRENLEAGSGVTTALRKAFRDYLIVNAGDRYIFSPVNYELKMHNRTRDHLDSTGNVWKYKSAEKGIDVSSHQGNIDWKLVKEDEVRFAICRAVYRGYGTGKLVVDDSFARNAEGCNQNGIRLGAYLFSQALDEKELDEEITLLLSTIAPYKVEGPVVMDIELTNDGTGRADNLSMEMRTKLARRFSEKIKEAGYRPMLYYNYESALMLIDVNELEDCEKWYASYTKDFYYPYYYTVWQYSSTGKVKGIDSDVDLDLWFED